MSSVAARPDVKATVEQVMSGEIFSGLLLDDVDQRALALEALLGKVVDDDTRVIWVGNPLRSPLTIQRFIIQIAGPEVDLREERGPVELARLIAKRVGQESRLLIVVQQPETIDAQTRDLLVGIGGSLGGEAVHVQFLFAGSSAFAIPQLPKPDVMSFSPRGHAFSPAEIKPPPASQRRRDLLPLLVLLLAITIGVVFSMAPTSQVGMPPTATVSAPRADIVPAPPPAAAVPSPEISLLRHEFDTFLVQRTPALPPMTDSEKDVLFTQFLTHHRRE